MYGLVVHYKPNKSHHVYVCVWYEYGRIKNEKKKRRLARKQILFGVKLEVYGDTFQKLNLICPQWHVTANGFRIFIPRSLKAAHGCLEISRSYPSHLPVYPEHYG